MSQRALQNETGGEGVQTAYNVKDFGAVGDGATDDTAAFALAIDNIPAAGGLLYIPAGVYKVAGLALSQRRDLSIIGCGTASVLAPTAQNTAISYAGCTRCHLGSLRIDGSLNQGVTGINISGNFDAKFFNLHIHDLSGDGIYVNGDDPTGTEIELSNITCRNNGGYGYHYTRSNATDTGGVYLTNFRALYNTQGAGGIKLESTNAFATPIFHFFINAIVDNYPAPAFVLSNVAHCRFRHAWATGSTSSSIFLVDGDGYMLEIDGAYFSNSHPEGYNLAINGTVNGILLDNLDFDNAPAAHVHIGSAGANFFLGQYQIFGASPLTDTLHTLYRRSNLVVQHGPVVFATDGNGGYSTTLGIEDISNPGQQKWLRNTNGTLQVLNTAFTTGIWELQDNGQMRWNNGAWISRHLSGTVSWTPGELAAGSAGHTTVSVAGAVVGDTVATGFSGVLAAGILISGAVTAADLVTVTVYNASGSAQAIGAGTLRADVWQH